jgi:hypothetical protein
MTRHEHCLLRVNWHVHSLEVRDAHARCTVSLRGTGDLPENGYNIMYFAFCLGLLVAQRLWRLGTGFLPSLFMVFFWSGRVS